MTTKAAKIRKKYLYGPLSTLQRLAESMDGPATSQDVKDQCKKALHAVGATDEFCSFFGDVLQCEHDMNLTVHRMTQSLREDNNVKDHSKQLKTIQDFTKSFNQWKTTTDSLTERGKHIPALQVDEEKFRKSRVLKALCSLETKKVNLREGDDIVITDTSKPNSLKIRNSQGQEGYVPALCCILPTPDKNPATASERLRVQLLVLWTESVRKINMALLDALVSSSNHLASEWKLRMINGANTTKDRVIRRLSRVMDLVTATRPYCDLPKLHNSLFSLERELTSMDLNGKDVGYMKDCVATLDKSVLCYQVFRKQWQLFRKGLEQQTKPIRFVENWSQLQPVKKGKNFRYYEFKMVVEDVETVEEITYINDQRDDETWRTEVDIRKETVETDQLTSTVQEEQKRFVIHAVMDPLTDRELTFQDAIDKGIVDQSKGMYLNPRTGQGMSIPEAMNSGKIKMRCLSTSRSEEQTKAIGLITVKTRVDERQYTIESVLDSITGEKIDPEEAHDRGILDEVNDWYRIAITGETISIDTAINGGWIEAEFDSENEEPEYEIKTYAIHSVVDQIRKKKVPFYEAVQQGLIERDTGNYYNNRTGEKVYVGEAIKRGFLKGKVVDNPNSMDIDAENRMVVERMDRVRKNVLKMVGGVAAFKRAAKKN